ncbi:hypothetical protein [Nitrosomonas sp.]|uniref:hypothetical protein n=1 Tax=Nitrosomonas sp. TaxID=42353 RepID=UPI0025F35E44|nr:hypothetical protein [Nitrosomonas sp.]MBV6446556.1 hypothetical protein [Nitrosomonas sp.]
MLKRYYSIKEAVEFLTLELKQNLSSMDILESAVRGEIRLGIWFDGNLATFKLNDDFLPDSPWCSLGGPPYSFRGYLKIPRRVITPTGGIVCFDPKEIIEVIESWEDHQLPEIEYPYFYGTYTCIPETGEVKYVQYKVNCDDAVIPTEDILALLSKIQKKESPQVNTANQNKSNMLATLNQASNKFWANVDKNDPGTYPRKVAIVAWLEKNGFSQTLAEKGATIIRPEWAPAGRRPEE